jgi:uncharacterized protein (TIGR04255 family)
MGSKVDLSGGVDEVALVNPPIIRVIAQVQLSPVMLDEETHIARVHERLRRRYPFREREHTVTLTIDSNGVSQHEGEPLWRFTDRTDDQRWMASISPQFVSLDAMRYSSRQDLIERLHQLVEAARPEFDGAVCVRVGVRYVNRLSGDDFLNRDQLVSPWALGPLGSSSDSVVDGVVMHSMTETALMVGERDGITMRHGVLPADALVLADVAPVDGPSWVLDVDAYSNPMTSVDAIDIAALAGQQAARAYGAFRSAVTDEFLRQRGGTP